MEWIIGKLYRKWREEKQFFVHFNVCLLSLSLILYIRHHLIFRRKFSSLSYSFCSFVSGWCSNKSVRILNFSPLCMLSPVTLKLFRFNATSFEGESSSKRQIHSSNIKTLFVQVISLLASPIIFLQCLSQEKKTH